MALRRLLMWETPASSTWTPLDLLATSSGIWLDTTDATKMYSDAGITLATVNTQIGRVADKNGSNHANQTTSGNRPFWDVAGKLIDYVVSDNSLVVTAATAVNDIWATGGALVCILETDSLGESSLGRVAQKSSGANGWQFYMAASSGSTYKLRFEASRSTQKGEWTMTNFDLTGSKFLLEWYYDGSSTSNNPTMFLNGTSISLTQTVVPTGTLVSDASNDLFLANRFDLTRSFDGRQGSYFIMKAIPSDPDKAKLRTYLGSQHGMTL